MNYVLYALLLIGCAGYAWGIVVACKLSLQKPPNPSEMPPFLAGVVTTIGAILATNLGAVLGIEIVKQPNTLSENVFKPLIFFSDASYRNLQITALYFYLLSLVTAAIGWGIKKFTSDPAEIVTIIPELTKTLLGVIVGAMGILLAKP
jgi:hypothetical protein